MPVIVSGPDGTEIEFPDGTPETTIKSAMAKRYGGAAPQTPQPAAPVAAPLSQPATLQIPAGNQKSNYDAMSAGVPQRSVVGQAPQWDMQANQTDRMLALGSSPQEEAKQAFSRGLANLNAKQEDASLARGFSGLGDLISAANTNVRDWWMHTPDRDKVDTLGKIPIELSGVGTYLRLENEKARRAGEPLPSYAAGFETDENYNPEADLAGLILNGLTWSTRGAAGGLINPRSPMAAVKSAAADVGTNLTMGATDLAAAGGKLGTKAASGLADMIRGEKPGANLPVINQTAVPVTTPAPAPGPVAAVQPQTPAAATLTPVQRPQAGPVSGDFAKLHPKVQSAFTRLLENSGVEPQRIPNIIRELDKLPPGRAEMVATELIRKFGAGDRKIRTNLDAVAGDLAVNAPKAGGDNAQAIVRENARRYMDQEIPYIEGIAERNFGPGVVATTEEIDKRLQANRANYQRILNPAKPYGNLRSPAKIAEVEKSRQALAAYLRRVDTSGEIPDWLKRDTIHTLNRDLREMGLVPVERNAATQGFTWGELVDQYPTQIAHALQSTYATAIREADIAKLGDVSAGAMVRDLTEMRGKSRVRANAADPTKRGYGLLHLLEEAAPGYKETRVTHGTEYGLKTAMTVPERFLSAAGDERKFAALLDDLDEMTDEQFASAKNQITTLVKDAIRQKIEEPSLEDIGAGQRGTIIPNLTKLAKAPVLDGLERAFGEEGKQLADAIRLSRASTETVKGWDPQFGPRTGNNLKNAENASGLYENPLATDKNIVDNTATMMSAAGVGTALSGNLPAALGIMSLAGARAIWQMIKNGRKLTPEQRTQFANFLFALRHGESPEVPRLEGPDSPPQLPAPESSPSTPPPVKPVKAGFQTNSPPEAATSIGGAMAGYTLAPDQNGDGIVDERERAMGGLGGFVSGVVAPKVVRAGVNAFRGEGRAAKSVPVDPDFWEPPLSLDKSNRVYSPGQPDDLGFITSAENVLANPPARFRDAKSLNADQWRKYMRDGGASKESFQWQIEPALKRLADEGYTGDIPKAKLEEALARERRTLTKPPERREVRHKLSGNDVSLPFEKQYSEYVAPGSISNYQQHVLTLPPEQGQGYKSHNWRSENPVGHIRTTNRTSANGEKVLHVEELQSDLHQEGAQYGYKGDTAPSDIRALQNGWDQASARYREWANATPERQRAIHNAKLPGDVYSGDALKLIDDPTGRELYRTALEAKSRVVNAEIGKTKAPPRAPMENWEEPFIRYALKQGADQGVDVVTFPTHGTLHKALQNEGTQKFYDQRLPNHLASVAKSLGLKVESVDVPFGKRASEAEMRSWDFDKPQPPGTVTVPAIRLTPEAKAHLKSGILMDAKDPGRVAKKAPAPAARPIRGELPDGGQSITIGKIGDQDFTGTLYSDPADGLSFHPNYPSNVWNDLGDTAAAKVGKGPPSTLKRMITPEGGPNFLRMNVTKTEGPKWSEGNVNQIGEARAPEIDEAVRNRFIGLVRSNPRAPKFSLELHPEITSKDTRRALLNLARDTDRVFVEMPDDTITILDRGLYDQTRGRYQQGKVRFEEPGSPPVIKNGFSSGGEKGPPNGFTKPLEDLLTAGKQIFMPNDPRNLNQVAEVLQGLPATERALIERNAAQANPVSAMEAGQTPEALAELVGRMISRGDPVDPSVIPGRPGQVKIDSAMDAGAKRYQDQLSAAILGEQRSPNDLINMDRAAGPIGPMERDVATLDRKMANDAWFPAREAERDAALRELILAGEKSGGGIPNTGATERWAPRLVADGDVKNSGPRSLELDRLREGVSRGAEMDPLNLSPQDRDLLAEILFNPERAGEAARMGTEPIRPWVSDAERKALQVGVAGAGGAAGVVGLSALANSLYGDKPNPKADALSEIIMQDKPSPYTVSDRLIGTANPSEPPPELNGHIEDTVVRAQQRLMALGYAPISLSGGQRFDDGRIGSETMEAVRRFQKNNDLPPTGELDPMTLRALWGGKNYGPQPVMREYGAPLAADPR